MGNSVRKIAFEAIESNIISNDTHQIRPYTIVEIWAATDHGKVRGVGLSRQGRNDKWDATIGYQIARGRAIKDAAKNAKYLR